MQINQAQIKQMKSEDKAYGEKQGKKPKAHQKHKNLDNYAKFRMSDVMAMSDD
jgi:hypothetical protein